MSKLSNNLVGKLVTAWRSIDERPTFPLPVCTGWVRAVLLEGDRIRVVLELVRVEGALHDYTAGDVGDLASIVTGPDGLGHALALSTVRHPDGIAELGVCSRCAP